MSITKAYQVGGLPTPCFPGCILRILTILKENLQYDSKPTVS